MIQFPGTNSTTGAGFSASVEDLGMSALNNANVSAIVNEFSQEQSYVRHVNFVNFTQPALIIGQSVGDATASDSGPYQDLYFRDTVGSCVILNSNGTRGIHNMTCVGNSSLPPAGVLLDGANNMIEDAHFEGFKDGIFIGSRAEASGDVISAVNGNSNGMNGNMSNVVHISNANGSQDLVLTGIFANAATSGNTAPNSIQDDLTNTSLSDASVATYALGEAKAGGYSRFTTSPNAPTWVVGGNAPSGGCTNVSIGSLYSNTRATTASTTLYVCVPVAGTGVGWTALTIP
jgi:hypothetical protein